MAFPRPPHGAFNVRSLALLVFLAAACSGPTEATYRTPQGEGPTYKSATADCSFSEKGGSFGFNATFTEGPYRKLFVHIPSGVTGPGKYAISNGANPSGAVNFTDANGKTVRTHTEYAFSGTEAVVEITAIDFGSSATATFAATLEHFDSTQAKISASGTVTCTSSK